MTRFDRPKLDQWIKVAEQLGKGSEASLLFQQQVWEHVVKDCKIGDFKHWALFYSKSLEAAKKDSTFVKKGSVA
jgi:hypothetical protein